MELDLISFAYAFTLTIGGIFGFVKAGSAVSLVMGLVCGAILVYGAYLTSVDPSNFTLSFCALCSTTFGWICTIGFVKEAPITHKSHEPAKLRIIAGVAAFLACLMGYRFMKSGKFMPSGLVMVLSVLMVIRFALRTRYWQGSTEKVAQA